MLHGLGYLTIQTAELERWRELAVDVLGMVPGDGPDPERDEEDPSRRQPRLAARHPAESPSRWAGTGGLAAQRMSQASVQTGYKPRSPLR